MSMTAKRDLAEHNARTSFLANLPPYRPYVAPKRERRIYTRISFMDEWSLYGEFYTAAELRTAIADVRALRDAAATGWIQIRRGEV